MNTKFRPIFILISMGFISFGLWFFYALKTEKLFESINADVLAPQVPDIVVNIATSTTSDNLGPGDSIRLFRYQTDECLLEWSVHIHARYSTPNLSLLFSSENLKTCPLSVEKVFELNQSILKKIFKHFDRLRFFELKINDARVSELSNLFKPFKMKIELKSQLSEGEIYKLQPN